MHMLLLVLFFLVVCKTSVELAEGLQVLPGRAGYPKTEKPSDSTTDVLHGINSNRHAKTWDRWRSRPIDNIIDRTNWQ